MCQTLSPADCAALINRSRRIVALTGAGLSTAAGIPDFRGPRGLDVSRRYDPEKVFEIGWFRRAPEYFYQFSSDFVATVKEVEPTFCHRFLAELERSGRLNAVITQNIDRLHQRAGSQEVVELHGSYGAAHCQSCDTRLSELSYAWWQWAMEESPEPPVAHCAKCGGILKPEIVFFGETVRGLEEAEQLVASCELLLVLGSSLQVVPAALLPYSCQGTTVVVNQQPVELPPAEGRYFVEAELDDYFRQVAACLAGAGSI